MGALDYRTNDAAQVGLFTPLQLERGLTLANRLAVAP